MNNWDSGAAKYDLNSKSITFYKKTNEFISKMITKGCSKIVDLGCGTGENSAEYTQVTTTRI